jgi:hypothetical protein
MLGRPLDLDLESWRMSDRIEVIFFEDIIEITKVSKFHLDFDFARKLEKRMLIVEASASLREKRTRMCRWKEE